jgi:hypothetical protein
MFERALVYPVLWVLFLFLYAVTTHWAFMTALIVSMAVFMIHSVWGPHV